MNVVVKIKADGGARGGSYEVLVPAIIDTDGYMTITWEAANGAALCMLQEMNPDAFVTTVDKVRRGPRKDAPVS